MATYFCAGVIILDVSHGFFFFFVFLRFEYDLPEGEARFRYLSVSVKNNSASFRSRDVVGQVGLKSSCAFFICTVTHTHTYSHMLLTYSMQTIFFMLLF